MGLAAFQRMRIRQIEKMKPENIKKEQEELKPITEETKEVEEVVENTSEVNEVEETTTRRKPKANN